MQANPRRQNYSSFMLKIETVDRKSKMEYFKSKESVLDEIKKIFKAFGVLVFDI